MKIIEKLKKFWNETLGPDYTDTEFAGLNIQSSNPIEVELAKSSEEIDEKVNSYAERRNAKRKGILESTKVDKSQLNKANEMTKSEKNRTKVEADKSDDFVK